MSNGELVEVFPNQILKIHLVEMPIVRPLPVFGSPVTEPDFIYVLNGEHEFRVDGDLWPALRRIAQDNSGRVRTDISLTNLTDEVIYSVPAWVEKTPFRVLIWRQWEEITEADNVTALLTMTRRQSVALYTVRG